MKNFKLLLVTTAILSTGALLVKAGELGTTINARANIVGTVTMTEKTPIEFGNIVSTSGTVIIGADGTVSGTANTVASGGKGYYNSDDEIGIHPGVVTISGNGFENFDGLAATTVVELSAEPITLKSGTGTSAITCGVVSNIGYTESTETFSGGDISYGGTFTLDPGVAAKLESGGSLNCSGSGTMTLVVIGRNVG